MSKPLEECSREELVEIVKAQKETIARTRKFGLVWEDKPEKVATDCAKKLPIVKEVADKAICQAKDSEPTNIIIEGDNYHSLSVLNYTHPNKIDVIYIDPPYNTGEKARDGGFIYNDRFVDKEDSFKHSKWLSFMAKRLEMAKSLLSDDGLIFISIDDHEQHYLKLLCDEIFTGNYVSDISIIGTANESNDGVLFQNNKESLLVYAKDLTKAKINRIDEVKQAPRSLSDAPTGLSTRLSMGYTIYYNEKTNDMIPKFDYDQTKVDTNNVAEIYHDDMQLINEGYIPVRPGFRNGIVWRWRWGIETFNQRKDEISIRKNGAGKYVAEFTQKGFNPPRNVQNFTTGTTELRSIIGQNSFKSPKSLAFLEWILSVAGTKESTILDFFAGSGTTGHAVLDLNNKDGGKRKFIMCTNNENGIIEDITYPRIRNVVNGYNSVAGIPANIRYFRTEFVEKNNTLDKLRRELSPACEDMIRIREGAYERVIDDDMLKVFKNARGLTAIIYDRFELKEYIRRIEELETDSPVHLYVFSYSKSDRSDEMPEELRHKYESQPIPEGVLEIYKRIFANMKGGKNA